MTNNLNTLVNKANVLDKGVRAYREYSPAKGSKKAIMAKRETLAARREVKSAFSVLEIANSGICTNKYAEARLRKACIEFAKAANKEMSVLESESNSIIKKGTMAIRLSTAALAGITVPSALTIYSVIKYILVYCN